MLDRKINLLAALFIGVVGLIGGVFLTSLLLRGYLRQPGTPVSPSVPVAAGAAAKTVTVSEKTPRRVSLPPPSPAPKPLARVEKAAPVVRHAAILSRPAPPQPARRPAWSASRRGKKEKSEGKHKGGKGKGKRKHDDDDDDDD